MKKFIPMRLPTIAITVVVLAIISSSAFVLTRPSKEEAREAGQNSQSAPGQTPSADSPSTPEANTQALAPSVPPADTPKTAGVYTDYSEAIFANMKDRRRVLFFHAQWCPQCRAIENDIKSGAVIPAGMTIFKVNYDASGGLRQKYGVTLQTTFVEADANGNLKKKHIAYDEPNLNAVLNALGR